MSVVDRITLRDHARAALNWLKIGSYDLPKTRPTAPMNSYRSYDDYTSGGAKYAGGISGDGTAHRINHRRTNLNSRSRFHDSLQGHGIVTRFADTVANNGLRIQLQPDPAIVGRDQEFIRDKVREITEKWETFAASKNSTRDGIDTLNQLQRLYQIYRHRDNDQFIRLYYTGDPVAPVQSQLIDYTQIRGNAYQTTNGYYSDNDGIIRDSGGRELAYKIWTKRNGKLQERTINRLSRSGRIQMLHCFSREYAGQGRGYSRLAHAQQELASVLDLQIAYNVKTQNQAMVVGALKPGEQQAATNLFKGFTNSAASALNQSDTTPAAPEGYEAELSDQFIPQAQSATPGMWIFNTPPGGELKFMNESSPTEAFSSYIYEQISYLSSSAGMPIEVLLMRFGNNYSASKAAMGFFQQVIDIERNEMASDFLQQKFAMWLSEMVGLGQIQIPGFSDPVIRAAWLNAKWYGAPLPDIEPVKTALARKHNISMGLTTGEREARNHNGSDFEANKQKILREYGDFVQPFPNGANR
ncbi:phage portal protein [candidate division KSB1 bacterium]|nr:phage portal protein [Phycisphaerae bacterium]NIQ92572.1 phage portal protein [Deltaproteobacteria bacterium]NIV97183.1 phage portal protein [candidate division KSB1 bacterium]